MEINEIEMNCVINPNQKAKSVEEVLNDLPEWFGLVDRTKEYIEQSRKLVLFSASINNQIVGFITLKETSSDTCEIHCMGVKKEYHYNGIGTRLFKQCEMYAQEKYEIIQVKTVDEGRYKEYDQTIAFYKKMGFLKLEVFPTLWDEWNPCLIMIKKLDVK